jgi:hypothetical protein
LPALQGLLASVHGYGLRLQRQGGADEADEQQRRRRLRRQRRQARLEARRAAAGGEGGAGVVAEEPAGGDARSEGAACGSYSASSASGSESEIEDDEAGEWDELTWESDGEAGGPADTAASAPDEASAAVAAVAARVARFPLPQLRLHSAEVAAGGGGAHVLLEVLPLRADPDAALFADAAVGALQAGAAANGQEGFRGARGALEASPTPARDAVDMLRVACEALRRRGSVRRMGAGAGRAAE